MKLIIIANRLPVKFQSVGDGEMKVIRSEGGLATGLDSLSLRMEKHWIGWPGCFCSTPDEELMIEAYLEHMQFHPVFLTSDDIQHYYEGYSNSILWPLCHYFYTYIEYDKKCWDTYRAVNDKFAQKAMEIIEPGDIVWVQDYHLMLLPQLLREKTKHVSIGYFHHIPFPSYELFRVLPERASLLNGLLGADLIGFHTHDYMRHFVISAEQVLEVRFHLDQVLLNNRLACVDALPMGINFNLYYNAITNPTIKEKADTLKKKFGRCKVILSVDRLDYSKGILHRLKGFAQFLEHYPEYREKVSMAMIVVPSRDSVDSYAGLKNRIDETIGTINGKYSNVQWTPVYYFYHGFDFEELAAFYHISDIALVTPLRDGMNLVAKEYLATKRNSPGVLILSEMAGSAIELTEAIIVNPNNIHEIENGILAALQMPLQEQKKRLKKMQKELSQRSVNHWAKQFISELLSIKALNAALNHEITDYPDKQNMRKDYRKASQRLLILDYDGTLSVFRKKPEDATPTTEIYQVLQKLCSDPHNKVVISSGRNCKTLEQWFGHLPLTLAAEHGAYYKENGQWHDKVGDETPWDHEILRIMKRFVEKTPGSSIEEKKTAIVWHYRNVNPWLASLRERQLFETLISPCLRKGLQIMRGIKIIEVKSSIHTKGTEAQRLLNNAQYDFILAIGDDTTDEDMFRALPPHAYTIKVGGMSETARFSIKSQSMVLPFLQYISE